MYSPVLTTSKNRKQNCPSLCSPVSFAAATEIAWCVTRPKNSREEYYVVPSDLVLPLKESLITSQNLHLVQRWCSEIIITRNNYFRWRLTCEYFCLLAQVSWRQQFTSNRSYLNQIILGCFVSRYLPNKQPYFLFSFESVRKASEIYFPI